MKKIYSVFVDHCFSAAIQHQWEEKTRAHQTYRAHLGQSRPVEEAAGWLPSLHFGGTQPVPSPPTELETLVQALWMARILDRYGDPPPQRRSLWLQGQASSGPPKRLLRKIPEDLLPIGVRHLVLPGQEMQGASENRSTRTLRIPHFGCLMWSLIACPVVDWSRLRTTALSVLLVWSALEEEKAWLPPTVPSSPPVPRWLVRADSLCLVLCIPTMTATALLPIDCFALDAVVSRRAAGSWVHHLPQKDGQQRDPAIKLIDDVIRIIRVQPLYSHWAQQSLPVNHSQQ